MTIRTPPEPPMETMETLTKADLARHLMQNLQLKRQDADLLVEVFLDSVVEALHRGEGVELRGFGSFRLRDRQSRTGRNPRTGESIHVPAKRVVYFKLGKDLRHLLIEE